MLSPGEGFPDFPIEGAPDFSGQWKLYLFLNRTPETILAVEFAYLASLRLQFESRNLRVLGVIVDAAFVTNYLGDCRDKGVDPPLEIVADRKGTLTKAVGVQLSHRASFLVDPSDTVRYSCGTDAAVPRNAFEILRVLDTLNPRVVSHPVPITDEAKPLEHKPN